MGWQRRRGRAATQSLESGSTTCKMGRGKSVGECDVDIRMCMVEVEKRAGRFAAAA